MNDSHPQSYYELALTNRQVMAAFVILLACIFIAFFAGIWVGRQEDSQEVLEASQQTVEAAADALDLGTLQFFSDSADESTGEPQKEPLQAKSSGTTLLEDVNGGDSGGETAVAAPPAPSSTNPEPQTRSEPVATGTVEEAAQSPVREAVPGPPPATSGGGDQVMIQVFSSADVQQAQGLKDRLSKAGFAAFISPVEVGGRTMHRVRIGPFAKTAEASQVADQVRREFKLDTWITH